MKERKASSGIIVCPDFTEDNVKAAGGYGNIRLLTPDGLCKLAELRDDGILSTEDAIRILMPQETVRLDYFIEIIYSKIKPKPKKEVEEKPKPPEEKEKVVLISPSRPDGVKFLLDNKAWAYVRKVWKKIDYLALYVSSPEKSITYYGRVKSIMPQEDHPKLASTDPKMKGRYVIELESVEKLDKPIAFAKGGLIQGRRYTTLDKLLKAKTTKDLWG